MSFMYSKTCVRQPPLKLILVVDVERWLSYKGTCHVILLAKLHDMYLYKTDNFFSHQPLFKVSLEGGSLTQVLLYTKNNTSPRMDSCATPAFKELQYDLTPEKVTLCFLLLR